MSATHNAAVLAALRERGERGLTPIDALRDIGSFRLGARIFDLRQAGHDIRTEKYTTPNGAVVARYVLRESRYIPTDGHQLAAFSEGNR